MRDPETKDKLAESSRNHRCIADADVVMITIAIDKNDPTVYKRWVGRDVMTTVEHMVLTAWELRYGTCWIGAVKQDYIKELLSIPKAMAVFNLLSIGVPDQQPQAKDRKLFETLFFAERYGTPFNLH